MKIISIHYSALVNTGNYENEKIGLDAALEDGDTVESVIEALKDRAFASLHRSDLLQERRDLRYEVQELNEKVNEAREQWEQTRAFLKAQGLRADPPSFPTFHRMLSQPEEKVRVEVVE
jgi:hypothetical protein